MMPAKIMTATIAVISNALPQPFNFRDELFVRHVVQVAIHIASVPFSKHDPFRAAQRPNTKHDGNFSLCNQPRCALSLYAYDFVGAE
jgi:hypothetical protein